MGPDAFLGMPGLSGLRPCAGPTLKEPCATLICLVGCAINTVGNKSYTGDIVILVLLEFSLFLSFNTFSFYLFYAFFREYRTYELSWVIQCQNNLHRRTMVFLFNPFLGKYLLSLLKGMSNSVGYSILKPSM